MAQICVYSFSYSFSLFNRYILNVSSLPNTILGIRNIVLNETYKALAFVQITLYYEQEGKRQ